MISLYDSLLVYYYLDGENIVELVKSKKKIQK